MLKCVKNNQTVICLFVCLIVFKVFYINKQMERQINKYINKENNNLSALIFASQKNSDNIE